MREEWALPLSLSSERWLLGWREEEEWRVREERRVGGGAFEAVRVSGWGEEEVGVEEEVGGVVGRGEV